MAQNYDGDVQVSHGKVGRCSQCNMAQCVDQCRPQAYSAKLHIKSPSAKNLYLFANGQTLTQITELPLEMVTEEALLSSDPFLIVIQQQNGYHKHYQGLFYLVTDLQVAIIQIISQT